MATGAAIQAPDGQTAPAAGDGTRLPVTAAVAGALAFVATYAAALLGHALAFGTHPGATVWPPNAIVLSALLLTAPRTWPAYLSGALAASVVVEVQYGQPGSTSMAVAGTGMVTCLLAASAIRHVLGRSPRLDRLHDVVIHLTAAAGWAPLVAVSAAAGVLVAAGLAPGSFEIWSAWLMREALTHATLTAALLAWLGPVPPGASLATRRLERGAFALAVVLVSLFMLQGPEQAGSWFAGALFLPLPLLLWAAVRLGPRGVTGAVAALTLVWSLGAATGRGPFASLADDVALPLPLFLLVVVAPTLLLAAAVAERRAAETERRESEARRRAADAVRTTRGVLQSAIDALSASIAILDERGTVIAVNEPWRRSAGRGGLPDAGAEYAAALGDGVQGVPGPEAERIRSAIREMLHGDRTDFQLESRCDEQGQRRWFQLRMIRFSDAHGVRLVLAQEDITELKQAEAGLRDLTGRLLRLQDEERRRIARELHDGAGQNLVALSMNLTRLARLVGGDERMGGIVADSLALVEQSLQEMRTLSYVLHPPTLDGVGLTSAIRWYVEGFAKRSGIEVRLDLPPDIDRLPQELERALFRVIQESLINVHRHSGSGTAAIRLRREPGLVRLDVSDEGAGFSGMRPEPGDGQGSFGGGIPGMRERLRQLGGYLDIRSDTRGTTVTAVAPFLVETDASHPAR